MSESWSLNSFRVPFKIFEFRGGKLYKVLFRVAWGIPPRKILGSLRLTKSKK